MQSARTAGRLASDERALPPDSELGEQLDLPELLGFPPVDGNKTEVVPTRKPGTHVGIRNTRTLKWEKYFKERGYRFPIEIFMATANMSVDELRRRLNCSALEAMNIILRAAGEAAPILHAKLASIEVLKDGEPGGRPARLAISGSLVDVTPTPTPTKPTATQWRNAVICSDLQANRSALLQAMQ